MLAMITHDRQNGDDNFNSFGKKDQFFLFMLAAWRGNELF